jgi:hypothetical protein
LGDSKVVMKTQGGGGGFDPVGGLYLAQEALLMTGR